MIEKTGPSNLNIEKTAEVELRCKKCGKAFIYTMVDGKPVGKCGCPDVR